MKSIKPNESFFTTYAQYLGVVLTLAMGVIALGYANPSSAAPKSCEEHPRPSCNDGSGGDGGDTILFDAKLVGELTDFGGFFLPKPLNALVVDGTPFPTDQRGHLRRPISTIPPGLSPEIFPQYPVQWALLAVAVLDR